MSNEHPSIKAVSASIVIPTWRRHKSLRRVLDSIQLQSDHDFEVVVVCDGPDPDTEWLARTYTPAFPLRWKYHSENQGVGAARNTGVRFATGSLIVFLDDDTVPGPNWLEMHRQWHESKGLVVCGKYVNRYSWPPRSATEALVRSLNGEWLKSLWETLERMLEGAEQAFWVGLNSSLERRAYLDAGGCDPAFSLQEEADLAARLMRDGYRFILDPTIVIQHHDIKDIVADRAIRAFALGKTDIYRLRREGAAIDVPEKLLALLGEGSSLRQYAERFCWYLPIMARCIAAVFRSIGEIARQEFLLKAWAVLSFAAAYWEGVRAAGIFTPDDVRDLIHHALRKPPAPVREEWSIGRRSRV